MKTESSAELNYIYKLRKWNTVIILLVPWVTLTFFVVKICLKNEGEIVIH